MRLLALSGSLRSQSTNTALLAAAARLAPQDVEVKLSTLWGDLPIFNPDLEARPAHVSVLMFAEEIREADGLLISCPEYVHAVPGGFKNAIDWLVSREELVGKPIALLHASHRGDDALAALRMVLSTVSDRFSANIFERFPLIGLSPAEITTYFDDDAQAARIRAFLLAFRDFCAG